MAYSAIVLTLTFCTNRTAEFSAPRAVCTLPHENADSCIGSLGTSKDHTSNWTREFCHAFSKLATTVRKADIVLFSRDFLFTDVFHYYDFKCDCGKENQFFNKLVSAKFEVLTKACSWFKCSWLWYYVAGSRARDFFILIKDRYIFLGTVRSHRPSVKRSQPSRSKLSV